MSFIFHENIKAHRITTTGRGNNTLIINGGAYFDNNVFANGGISAQNFKGNAKCLQNVESFWTNSSNHDITDIYFNGSTIGIGTATPNLEVALDVIGGVKMTSMILNASGYSTTNPIFEIQTTHNSNILTPLTLDINNNIVLGNTSNVSTSVYNSLVVDGDTYINGSLYISGNLTLSNIKTEINTTNLLVNDSIFILADNQIGNLRDTGLVMNRGPAHVNNSAFIWDESEEEFTVVMVNRSITNVNGVGSLLYNQYSKLHVLNFETEYNSSSNKYRGNVKHLDHVIPDFMEEFDIRTNNSKIYIDGNADSPFSLVRGTKYRFNITNASITDPFHVVRMYPNNAIGPIYTDGIINDGISETSLYPYVLFDMPHNAPGNLAIQFGDGSVFNKRINTIGTKVQRSGHTYLELARGFNDNEIHVYTGVNGSVEQLTVSANGSIGIGVLNPNFQMEVNGNMQLTADLNPVVNLTYNIGTSNYEWHNNYVDKLHLGQNSLNLNGEQVFWKNNATFTNYTVNHTKTDELYVYEDSEFVSSRKWLGNNTIYKLDGNVQIGNYMSDTTLTVDGSVKIGDTLNTTRLFIDEQWFNESIHNYWIMPNASTKNIHYETLIGNVGINMPMPQYPLDIRGSVNSTYFHGNAALLTDFKSNRFSDGNNTIGDLYYILGNVGIGTPESLADQSIVINGGLLINSTYNTGPYINGTVQWNGTDFIAFVDNVWKSMTIENGSFIWSNNSDTSVVYYMNANVGINTEIPTTTLDIQGILRINETLIINNEILIANGTELSTLTGIKTNVTELNILTGITSNVTELNYLDGMGASRGITRAQHAVVTNENHDIDFSLNETSMIIVNNITIVNNLRIDNQIIIEQIGHLELNDTIITLGNDKRIEGNDSGIIFNRGTDTTVGFIWDESNKEFGLVYTNVTSNTIFPNISIQGYTDLHVNNLYVNNTTYASAYFGNGKQLVNTTSDYSNEYIVSVMNNKYIIDGVSQANITLVRGEKYYFNLLNVPNIHQFTISESDIGGGSNIQFTDGVIDNDNNYLEFNIPHDAPGNLYYQSQNDINMGGRIILTDAAIYNSDLSTMVSVEEFGRFNDMIFKTNNTERLTIKTDGSIGINRSTATYNMQVGGKTNVRGNLLPGASNTFNIGTNNMRFGNLYAQDVYVSNNSVLMEDNVLFSRDENTGKTSLQVNKIFINKSSVSNINIIEDGQSISVTKWQGTDNIHFVNRTGHLGYIGIGTNTSQSELEVIGNISIQEHINVTSLYINEVEYDTSIELYWDRLYKNSDIHYLNGDVGINTSTFDETLTIGGLVNSTNYRGNASLLTNQRSNRWNVINNDLHYLRGNVSIGTESSYAEFTVNNGMLLGNVTDNTVQNGTMRWSGENFDGYKNGIWTPFIIESNLTDVWFYNNISNTIHYNNGKVGIGINIPVEQFDVIGTTGVHTFVINDDILLSNASELNKLKDITSSVTELNKMHQVNATVTELNYLNNVTPGSVQSLKVIMPDSNKNLNFNNGSLIVNDLYIKNNLNLLGEFNLIATENLNVNASLLMLKGHDDTTVYDSGLIIERGTGENAGFIWDESANEFIVINTTHNSNVSTQDINISEYAALSAGSIQANQINATYYIGNGSQITGLLLNKWLTGTNDNDIYFNNNICIGTNEQRNKLTINGSVQIFTDLNTIRNENTHIIIKNESQFSVLHSNPATGHIAFGTNASALYQVNVNGAVHSNTLSMFSNRYGDQTSFVDVLTNDEIKFVHKDTGGVINQMTINMQTEKIGIGIARDIPFEQFDINGTMNTSKLAIGLTNPSFREDLEVIGAINATQFIGNGSTLLDILWTRNTVNADIHYTGSSVGIGTIAPTSDLDVNGRIKTNMHLLGNGSEITNADEWITSGNNAFYLHSDVGVHTAYPTAALEVIGTLKATQLSGDGGQLTNIPLGQWTETTDNSCRYSKGRISINTDDTKAGLTIKGSVEFNVNETSTFLINTQTENIFNVDSVNHRIGFLKPIPEYTLDADVTLIAHTARIGNQNGGHLHALQVNKNNSHNDIQFSYVNGTDTHNRMYISSMSGNVGIGYKRDIPIEQLDINGSINVQKLIIGNEINLSDELQITGNITANTFIGNISHINNINNWIRNNNDNNVVTFEDTVGIGTNMVTSRLEVDGNVSAIQYIGNGLQLTDTNIWSNTGSVIYYTAGNVAVNRVFTDNADLHIDGTLRATSILADDVSGVTNITGINWIINNGQLYSNSSVAIGTDTNLGNLTIQNKSLLIDSTQHELLKIDNILIVNSTSRSVNINTENIDYDLNVCGTVRTNQLFIGSLFNKQHMLIDINTTSNIQFKNDDNILYANTTTGYFGIGPTKINPQAELDVANTIKTDILLVNTTSNGKDDVLIYGNINANAFIGNGSEIMDMKWLRNRNDDNIIYNNGRVGLGTNTPSSELEVAGTLKAQYYIGNGSKLTNVERWSNNDNHINYIDGTVSIGQNTSNETLTINGDINALTYIFNNTSGVSGLYEFWKVEGTTFSNTSIALINENNINLIEPNITFYVNGVVALTNTNTETDVLHINNNNNTLFIINQSTNNIGINIINPAFTLDIHGDCKTNKLFINNSNNSSNLDFYAFSDTTNINIHNDTSTLLYVDSSSNAIGIHNTVPTTQLDVNGTIRVNRMSINNSITANELYVNGDINATTFYGLIGAETIQWTRDLITNDMYYSTGNVGIFDITPTHNLSVNGTIRTHTLIGNGSALTNIDKWIQSNNDIYINNSMSIGIKDTINNGVLVDGIIKTDLLIGGGRHLSNIIETTVWTANVSNNNEYCINKRLKLNNSDTGDSFIINGSINIENSNDDGKISEITTERTAISSTINSVSYATLSSVFTGTKSIYNNSYSIFAGGKINNTTYTAKVEIYNELLNEWIVNTLSTIRDNMAIANAGPTTVFYGGNDGSIYFDTIDLYNTSSHIYNTGSWSVSTIAIAMNAIGSCSIDDGIQYQKAIFGGGKDATAVYNNVDIYDSLTATWSHSSLSVARHSVGIECIDDRVYFMGGFTTADESTPSNIIDIYYYKLDKWSFDYMDIANGGIITAKNNRYIAFAKNSRIKLYDSIFNKWTTEYLSSNKILNNAIGVGDILYFIGGDNIVDIYDGVHKNWTTSEIDLTNNYGVVQTYSNKLIVHGGNINTPTSTNQLNIYKFELQTTYERSIAHKVLDLAGTKMRMANDFTVSYSTSTSHAVSPEIIINTGDNRVISIAGTYTGSSTHGGIYSTNSNSWTSLNIQRSSYNEVTDGAIANGYFMIAGGRGGTTTYDDVLLYNLKTNESDNTFNLAYTARNHGIMGVGHLLMVCGGERIGHSNPSNLIEIYDTVDNSWSFSTMKTPRTILQQGGVFNSGPIGFIAGTVNEIEIYDVRSDSWSYNTISYSGLTHGVGEYPWAVFTHSDNTGNMVDIYNIDSKNWYHTTISQPRRCKLMSIVDDKLFMAGGYDGTNLYSTIDIIDLTTLEHDIKHANIPFMSYGKNMGVIDKGNTVDLILPNIEYITSDGSISTGPERNLVQTLTFKRTRQSVSSFNINKHNGFVGIGTDKPYEKLDVHNGNIKITNGDFIIGTPSTTVPDYVFEDTYPIMPLDELNTYVKEHKHLPNIPNSNDIVNYGYSMTDFQMKLLEKVEEISLYTLDIQENINNYKSNTQIKQNKIKLLKEQLDTIRNNL
jgi:hypothetical protein